jgi:DNA-binding response OmpR family regulator
MAAILISEPNFEIRELLARVIEAMACETATSPATDADAVDLLLVEPGWPEGLALARRLRAARPELPIVLLSIYPPQLESELLSPTAYLVKPFSVAELQGVLRNALAAGAVAAGAASAPMSHQTQ